MARGSGSARTQTSNDTTIVRAAIHPAIGIGRIGNSAAEFFAGPEVSYPGTREPGFYRDASGALKRQAARFRIYGYNAAGEVVAELTAANATITWTAHLRNEKAAWYQFQMAMDIPEVAHANPAMRRNGTVTGPDRAQLVIDGGSVAIAGTGVAGPAYQFNGQFLGTSVYLGELQTDDSGRLLVLGGQGISWSPAGQPLQNFANNDGWHDDTSDGPVTAAVTVNGQAIPVDPAWVVIAPPNYAPNLKTLRTMYDLMFDLFVRLGLLPPPGVPSFTRDILPIFQRMSGFQWVNEGFARAFGYAAPLDFGNPEFLVRMSSSSGEDAELRRQIANSFRNFPVDGYSRTPLPWMYGDAPAVEATTYIHQNSALSNTQLGFLKQWAAGQFLADYIPSIPPPGSLSEVPLAEQPAMLDRAALEFCLADAFHPGCEMTWPVRHGTMFMAPFRILHRDPTEPVTDYGPVLTPAVCLAPGGPLFSQGAGWLTRWMAVPWQTDTASCLSGYDPDYDPYLPTFWPARVPNQVLYDPDYQTAMDPSQPRDVRIKAFRTRGSWPDMLPGSTQDEKLASMLVAFPYMGIVEERPGVTGDPDLPPTMQVSTFPLELLFPLMPGPVMPPAGAPAAATVRTVRAQTSAPHAGRFDWRRS